MRLFVLGTCAEQLEFYEPYPGCPNIFITIGRLSTYLGIFENAALAEERISALSYERYSPEHGWSCHRTSIYEVPDELILQDSWSAGTLVAAKIQYLGITTKESTPVYTHHDTQIRTCVYAGTKQRTQEAAGKALEYAYPRKSGYFHFTAIMESKPSYELALLRQEIRKKRKSGAVLEHLSGIANVVELKRRA